MILRMRPDQEACLRTVQGDIRGAIDFLYKPCLNGMDTIQEALDHLRRARDIVDDTLLNAGSQVSQQDTISAQARDIARSPKSSGLASHRLITSPWEVFAHFRTRFTTWWRK